MNKSSILSFAELERIYYAEYIFSDILLDRLL